VNCKAKNERKTVCETAFHLRKRSINSLITDRAEFFCLLVTSSRWFLPRFSSDRPEICGRIRWSIVVGPLGFRACALFGHTFYSVANLGAVIERYAVFDASLVIINEETRWNEVAQFLLFAIELDGRGDCICGTGADFSLIINSWATSAQIGFGGKHSQLRQRRRVEMITIIRKVRHPAQAETVSFWGRSFHCSI